MLLENVLLLDFALERFTLEILLAIVLSNL